MEWLDFLLFKIYDFAIFDCEREGKRDERENMGILREIKQKKLGGWLWKHMDFKLKLFIILVRSGWKICDIKNLSAIE